MREESLVHAGQVAAERLMVDTCTIKRPADGTFNETTGVYPDASTVLYTGKCRVRYIDVADNNVDAGGRAAAVREYQVSVPADTVVYAVGDRVTVTASGLDATQAGLVLTVQGVLHGTHITARRLRCQEVTA